MTPDDRDPIELQELRDLLADRARVQPHELEPLRGAVATLPSRHRRGRAIAGVLAAAAGITVLVGFVGVLALGSIGGRSGAAPRPPNPAYFAGDPRLAVCNAAPADAEAIFELQHLADYPAQLPHAYELVGLTADLSDPALVIVFKGPGSVDRQGATPAPGTHDLCLVVGADAAHWQPVGVVAVDTTGLEAFLPEPTSTPIAKDLLPWVARCGGAEAGINRVLQLPHGTDAMTLSSVAVPISLMTADPMTIVAYDGVHPFAPLGTPPAPGATVAPRPAGYGDLCVLVGADAATATRTIVEMGPGAPADPTVTDAPKPTSDVTGPTLVPSSILRPQIAAADCAALGFSEGRCSAVVERARGQAELDWAQIAGVRLAKPKPSQSLGGSPIADVTFTLTDGSDKVGSAYCVGIGQQYDPACTDHPEVYLEMPYGPAGGYHDIPCGTSGNDCATPVPTVNPKAPSVPLEIAAQDYPLAVGHQEIVVGQATLPNGILSDARFSLADPTTQAFVVEGSVRLVVRSQDPTRGDFTNAYTQGWHPGSEVVDVVLVVDVVSITPGAVLEVRDLVVR